MDVKEECDISTREWIRLQLRMKPDDEVWYFSGFLGQNLGTSAGIALMRHGKPIEQMEFPGADARFT